VGPQRAQETAYQYAMSMRFGQADGLLPFVEPAQRPSYATRYARWRRTLRILDLELTGVRLLSADEANVSLVVGWSKTNETTLRTTVIAQTWRSKRSQWFLVGETDIDGDRGLFTEGEGG